MPTNLSAVVTGNMLRVSGNTAQSSPSRVEIKRLSNSVEVEDNGTTGVLVPIQGTALATHNINASAVTGAGVSISSVSVSSLARILTGSALDDYIYASGSHLTNDILYGGAGNDFLFGNLGNDRLYGGVGADRLNGGNGNDFLYGGLGQDLIDGGAGSDTFVLLGARSEYQIDIVDGLYQISHIGGTRADGIDRFANVENLQFTDQTVAISPAPTNLSAVVTGNMLRVSGNAAQSSSKVDITRGSNSVEVEDNGTISVLVPIQGTALSTHNINASAVTGAGVNIFSSSVSSLARTLTGSAQDDYIYASGNHLTNDILYGGAGNDFLYGDLGNDRLHGGVGSDVLNGGNGNDFLTGAAGQDVIDGGAGIDTFVLLGARSEYQIDIVDGLYQISHIGGTRADGIDRFSNVENLQFTDQTVAVNDWFLV